MRNKWRVKLAAFPNTEPAHLSLLQFRKNKDTSHKEGKKAEILTFGLSNQITIKKNTPLTVATEIGFQRT